MNTVRELLIQAEQAEQQGDMVLANHLVHEAIELANYNKRQFEQVNTESLVNEIWL